MVEFGTLDILRNLIDAALWTVVLSVIAFAGGALVGLVALFALVSGRRLPVMLARGYVEAFQGTPLLMQLFLIFFGLPLAGIEVSAWTAAIVSLVLFTGAFLAEIWRGCVEAVPKGQSEAAQALAMSYVERMRWVILPQAMRIAVPPTVGFSVQVVKGTALTSIIGFVELAKAGTMIANATFDPFTVYGFVALIYFALCYPLSFAARRLERRLHVAR
ncbi:amino acid ABC transporter permease [uncultured Tistrella sp.]|uniref:amino acid ABC transporter permease n=1 Tax=Tistrella mobilis TaxID=171437 RepID=UPI000C0B7DE1|nr:amino acid ABC transporter permease [uncultured Tistrella sp.]MAM75747.1 amino acid ABC transporter permease [Tistrella sp.]